MASTALHTDHYELTMVDAALAAGLGERRAVFEVFARQLPPGRRYGVVAGVERMVDAVNRFRFATAELAFLREAGFLRAETLAWLGDYRFSGDITGYREGDLYFPGSPVLTVEGGFAECVLLETVVLSILNHDSAVASAAARIVHAARGRPVIEMGGRRVHEEAAVAAARAAWICGLGPTSNLEAGRRYGVPTAGTSAHAFTLLHGSDRETFEHQLAALGHGTTLLVDTYDIPSGIRSAVAAGGPTLGAVRIDSGHLPEEAVRARALLDELGNTGTRIVASGDLDEYRLAELAGCPVDAYGVGTALVTGSGAPTGLLVYKLVARGGDRGEGLVPVAKTSAAKTGVAGRKWAWRVLGDGGHAEEEVTRLSPEPPEAPAGRVRPLQVALVAGGRVQRLPSLEEIRDFHRAALAELGPEHLALDDGPPALTAHHQRT